MQRKPPNARKIELFTAKEKENRETEARIKDGLIAHPAFKKLISGEKLTDEEMRILKAIKKNSDRKIFGLK